MSDLVDFLKGLAGAAERVDKVDRGETDPLRIVEALLGRPTSTREEEQWWHLFGLTDKPESRAVLDGAWRRYAVREHPDKGGDAISFGHMRRLYERVRANLPA